MRKYNTIHSHYTRWLLAVSGLVATVPLGGAAAAGVSIGEERLTGEGGAGVAFDTGTPSLRDYLARRRAALFSSLSDVSPRLLRAKVTAESRSGVRRLRIRDFQYLSDSDRDYAGYSLGAPSWDTEVAVIASSVADEFAIQAAAKNIPLDSLEVTVTSHPDAPEVEKTRKVAYPRNIIWTAYIVSPASDAQLEDLRQSVERTSPILALLREPQGIPHGKVVYKKSSTERAPGLPPGLRDFLVEKRVAVLKRQGKAAELRDKEEWKSGTFALFAKTKLEDGSGIRNSRTSARGFQILHDNSRTDAGYDIAPSSYEHQLGVLGTCITHITEIQAAARELVLDSIEVHVEGTLSPRNGSGVEKPPRYENIRYTVHIESPEPEEAILALRDAVEATCPIYNLLNDSQTITGRLVRSRAPEDFHKR